jgi:hypothetical protein
MVVSWNITQALQDFSIGMDGLSVNMMVLWKGVMNMKIDIQKGTVHKHFKKNVEKLQDTEEYKIVLNALHLLCLTTKNSKFKKYDKDDFERVLKYLIDLSYFYGVTDGTKLISAKYLEEIDKL